MTVPCIIGVKMMSRLYYNDRMAAGLSTRDLHGFDHALGISGSIIIGEGLYFGCLLYINTIDRLPEFQELYNVLVIIHLHGKAAPFWCRYLYVL